MYEQLQHFRSMTLIRGNRQIDLYGSDDAIVEAGEEHVRVRARTPGSTASIQNRLASSCENGTVKLTPAPS